MLIGSSRMSPTIAAQTPTVESQVDQCEFGHIPIAIPIPRGATRSTSKISSTIRSFLDTA